MSFSFTTFLFIFPQLRDEMRLNVAQLRSELLACCGSELAEKLRTLEAR